MSNTASSPSPSRLIAWLAFVAVCVAMIATGVVFTRGMARLPFLQPPAPPRVTHDLVVEQVRDVARLVSTEMTVRDVVVYEGSRYGLTKRALLVVTGKVQAG